MHVRLAQGPKPRRTVDQAEFVTKGTTTLSLPVGNRGGIGWPPLGPTREHLRVCVWAVSVWQRIFGSRRLGDPAHGSEAVALGQAQQHVRGNGLSCGRYGGRPSGNRIGCRLLEAHVGKRMTSALEALDPADPTIGI